MNIESHFSLETIPSRRTLPRGVSTFFAVYFSNATNLDFIDQFSNSPLRQLRREVQSDSVPVVVCRRTCYLIIEQRRVSKAAFHKRVAVKSPVFCTSIKEGTFLRAANKHLQPPLGLT